MILGAKDYMKIPRFLALKLCLFLVTIAALPLSAATLTLTASPSAVDFSYNAPEPQPLPVFVTVTASDGSSPVLTVVVVPPPGIAATLFPQPPVNGDTIQAVYNANTLNTLLAYPGVYSGSYTVSAPGFQDLTIPLTFNVGGTLSVFPTPTSLTFPVPGPTVETVELAGTGAIAFDLSVTTSSGGNWLTATASAGYTPANLTVTITPGNLAGGTYQGSIFVNPPAGGSPLVVIPVTMQIGSNTLAATPSSLSFAYTTGGTTPPSQVVQISSSLAKDTYTAQALSNGNWLLANGVTTVISGSLPASVNVSVNPSALAAGAYSGTINVTDADGNTDVVTVSLTVGGISTIANPTSLMFVSQVGEAEPPSQIVEVNGTVNASFTATVNGAWITVSSLGGVAPAELMVTANPAGLAAGTYNGTVVIDLDTHVQSIAVTLVVSADAVLMTNPGAYLFNYSGGSAAPSPQALSVTISSGGSQSFTYATGLPSWLSITGGAVLSTPATLTVTLSPQTLPNGTYEADIILTPSAAGGYPLVVPILLLVTGSTAVVPNPASLSFSATSGSAPQSKTVEVTAAVPTPFTTSASTASGGSWLTVSPASGAANAVNLPITVTASAANLAAGSYSGAVTITTNVGVQTKIPVAITVSSSGGPVTVSPSSLTFAYSLNGTLPAAQTLQVTGTQTFSASAATTSGGPWLAVTPTSGTGDVTLTVTANPAGLATGTYSGSITISATGVVSQTVTVTLTVSAASTLAATPNPLTFAYAAGNPNPPAQTVTVTSTGQAVTFTATASSSGWLSVTQSAPATPATLTVAVNPANLGVGTYTGSIALNGGAGAAQLTINVTLTVTAPLPSIDHISNAASYQTGGVAPGELVTVFGSALGPTIGVGATISKGYIPTTLANATVTFNGYAGPILYAGAGQINTIVPYELAGASNVTVESTFGAARSNSMTLAVVPSAPGIFSANASGQGGGAILDLSYQLVTSANPVSAGDIIQVFATGQGQTSPGGVDGLIEPSVLPLPSPLLVAGATVGGIAADIQYVGAAPGLVAGALQVNVVVPPGVTSGPAALFISIGGASSQTGITVAIK